MRIFTLTLGLLLSSIFSSLTMADWVLQNPSSVNILTSKNVHVTEVHHFKTFDATVKSSGAAALNIDLSSIDTRIKIRDKRILEHLFEVSRFTTARFETDIPAAVFKQAQSGIPVEFELKGTLSLHGETVAAQCHVVIRQNNDKTVSVTAITPLLVDANDFNLVAGINKLQEMASLKSITHTVPVMFDLTFQKSSI